MGTGASGGSAGASGEWAVGSDRFAPGELAIVCSHYALGVIRNVREFRRGSRRSPKVVLDSSTGLYLLKRRAPGRDDPGQVQFAHAVQQRLAERGFPVARLVRTCDTGETCVRLEGRVYEAFEFVQGTRYDQSLEATGEAGRALAFFHKLLADFEASQSLPRATYHELAGMPDKFASVAGLLADPKDEGLADRLHMAYRRAGLKAEQMGVSGWPTQIVHSDWHPGNLVFSSSGSGPHVAAVLDYDSARLAPRVIDVANGALQFSILMPAGDPEQWPAYADESRFKRFCRGYDGVPGCVLSTVECEAIPWLMIEALIVEAVIPIAATGRFGQIDGATFLRVVERKAGWLEANAARLTGLLTQ